MVCFLQKVSSLRKKEIYTLKCELVEGARMIRDTKRELKPLSDGLAVHVRGARGKRLRSLVRARDAAATIIQVTR